MANPTSNYGFVLPTSSDLVTDLPADFDVALQGVDTRLKALNPATTLGDLNYASATANTNTRLGVGSTGQVLTVAGGVPSWATPAGGSDTWSLLSTVSLSGLSSTTISSITSDKLILFVVSARNATGIPDVRVRPNNNSTAANYKQTLSYTDASGGSNTVWSYDGALTGFDVADGDDSNTSISLWFELNNCKSTSYKTMKSIGGSRAAGASIITTFGSYVEAAAVTSITLLLSSSSFNAGTLYVYGA